MVIMKLLMDMGAMIMERNRRSIASKFFLCWAITAVGLGFIFNSINKTGQSMGEIVFLSVFLGFFLGTIFFMVVVFATTKKAMRKGDTIPYVAKYVNPYLVESNRNGVGVPDIRYDNIFLQKDERLIYAVPARTFVEKEQVTGYTGGNAGVSVRIAKGVSVRTGSSKGKAVRQNIIKFNDGDYVLTNKRVVFVSKNDSFEYSLKKISTAKKISSDAFIITQSGKQKNICMDESQLEIAFDFTKHAINEAINT